jgi:hypothetical protein
MTRQTQEDLEALAEKMLKPREFTHKGEPEPCLWGCAQCGTIHAHKVNAVQCYTCYPSLCKTEGCGTRLRPRRCYTVCQPCKDVIEAKKLAEVVAAAKTKILYADYEHEVFFDPDGEFHYGRESLDDYICERVYPRFGFGVHKVFLNVDSDSILENAFENMMVDADPQDFINGEAEFKKACDEFNKAQSTPCYHEDRSVVIFFDWPDPKTFGHEEGEVHEDWPERWDVEKVMSGEEPCL